MKDARFTTPTPSLLARVVDMLDRVPMEYRDTKGDLYEYMLGKIAVINLDNILVRPRRRLVETFADLGACSRRTRPMLSYRYLRR